MFEFNGQLETWYLSEEPAVGKVIETRRLVPHRLDYLHYEGPVSDNRGSVTQLMNGTFVGDVGKLAEGKPAAIQLFMETPMTARFEVSSVETWSVAFRLFGSDG